MSGDMTLKAVENSQPFNYTAGGIQKDLQNQKTNSTPQTRTGEEPTRSLTERFKAGARSLRDSLVGKIFEGTLSFAAGLGMVGVQAAVVFAVASAVFFSAGTALLFIPDSGEALFAPASLAWTAFEHSYDKFKEAYNK